MFGMKLVNEAALKELVETASVYTREREDTGWINLANGTDSEIFAEGFQSMVKKSRLYYYKSPLAGQWVNLTCAFVFGEGIQKPRATDPMIQDVVDEFWADKDNQLSFTSFLAQHKICAKLQYEGNLFLALFTDEMGAVRVRVIDTLDVADLIRDGEDKMRTNFYKIPYRKMTYNYVSDSYDYEMPTFIYYSDKDVMDPEVFGIPKNKLADGLRIYHVKINCDINDKFGVPELYRGLDWMKAHKDMAGDLATLIKALSQFAWKKKVKGTAKQVNAIQTAMNARLNRSNQRPATGATQIENESVDMQSVKVETGGAQVSGEGMRQMLLMISASSGMYEHYLVGDSNVAKYASAKVMELPMVKRFLVQQEVWRNIYNTVIQFAVDKKIEAGVIPGEAIVDEKHRRIIYKTKINRTIDTDFPAIIEDDLKPTAEALAIAKTNNFMSPELCARTFMGAANINNINEELGGIDFSEPEPVVPEVVVPAVPKLDDKGNPIIEAAIIPIKRDAALRQAKKSNYVKQRMNGYRKALAGEFRQFRQHIYKGLQFDNGAGNIKDMEEGIRSLVNGMQKQARKYFDVAIGIGAEFTQSYVKKQELKETLYESNRIKDVMLEEKLAWNEKYLVGSLSKDVHEKLRKRIIMPFDNIAEVRKEVMGAVDTFAPRVEQYVGAFWMVEEEAVKRAGQGTGLMANFIGADDNGTCDGCNEAMAANPWGIDEIPEPGSHDCGPNCRHAIQILE